MRGVIVVVSAAFDLTVSEVQTEIVSLRTKRVPESTAKFTVEAAGQVYNQTKEFVYLGGDVNHNADLSIKVDRCIRNAWCCFRKYTLELYDRPTATFELKIRVLRAEVLETMMYDLVTWSPRVRHYESMCRAPHLPDSLHRLVKEQSHRPLDLFSGRAYMKTGSESIKMIMHRRRIMFADGAYGGHETAEVRDVRRTGGGRGLRVGAGKRVDGCLLDDIRAFGINANQWTTATQDEREWCKMAEQETERFMVKWIAAEKTRAGLRHAVVFPNVSGMTKERIAQRTRVRAGSLAILD